MSRGAPRLPYAWSPALGESDYAVELNGGEVAATATIATLGVQDLKRSIRFYEAGLGLSRVPYEPETIAFFDFGGALNLRSFPETHLQRMLVFRRWARDSAE